jgi:hypothetical protein
MARKLILGLLQMAQAQKEKQDKEKAARAAVFESEALTAKEIEGEKAPYMSFKYRDTRLGLKREFFERNLKMSQVQRDYLHT